MIWSKRAFMAGGAAALGACNGAPRDSAITPAQGYGPFYPRRKPLEQDADLTRITGRADGAVGVTLDLNVRALSAALRPLSANVEIWQANAAGRYAHPGDRHDAPLDANFQGYGVQSTDAEGRLRFMTVMPGPYPSGVGFMRARHIHFKVTGAWGDFVTVMYFPNDPLLGQDRVFRGEAEGGRVFCDLDANAAPTGSAPLPCDWDIVMPA